LAFRRGRIALSHLRRKSRLDLRLGRLYPLGLRLRRKRRQLQRHRLGWRGAKRRRHKCGHNYRGKAVWPLGRRRRRCLGSGRVRALSRHSSIGWCRGIAPWQGQHRNTGKAARGSAAPCRLLGGGWPPLEAISPWRWNSARRLAGSCMTEISLPS